MTSSLPHLGLQAVESIRMNIKCPSCGADVEIDAALQERVRSDVLTEEHERHAADLQRVRVELAKENEAALAAASEAAEKRVLAEREALAQSNATELEIEKAKLRQQAASAQKKAEADSQLLIEKLTDDAKIANDRSTELAKTVKELTDQVRTITVAAADAELANKKALAEEEKRIREQVKQAAEEENRLELAKRDKQISDLGKALDEATRKAHQGSQQLQGEVLELDIEALLRAEFRDDDIEPVPKGVRGADITHVIRSRTGKDCGIILWEVKNTKNWTDSWIPKLKDDLRNAQAKVAVIISDVLPKHITQDIGHVDGIWICRPQLALVLGTLLRNGLVEVARQRHLQNGMASKAESLYEFVISHEFIQQIEAMVETYQEMQAQIGKERAAFEKLWKQREAQTHRLLHGTANIIGSMQGHIGQASMPAIKGLELAELSP